jgi:hypothetical protein
MPFPDEARQPAVADTDPVLTIDELSRYLKVPEVNPV